MKPEQSIEDAGDYRQVLIRRTEEKPSADRPAPATLKEADRRILGDARKAEGLPIEADLVLQNVADSLAEFKRDFPLSEWPTPRALEDEAREIERSARKLAGLLATCDTGNFMRIDGELVGRIDGEGVADLGCRVSAVADALEAVADAARQVAEQRNKEPSSRAHVAAPLAGFVASLAHQLKPYGVKAAEGGPFDRLCWAVFAAAWPGASHKGALRHFIGEWRDDYARRGLVLAPGSPTGGNDPTDPPEPTAKKML